jgi:signal transduction histidine kinase/CheY-like chemotaxis protein
MTTVKSRTTVAAEASGGRAQRGRAAPRTRLRAAEVFAKRVRAFSAQLRQRPQVIARASANPADLDPHALREALAELATQHEELQVAEEELRAQVDELGRLADVAAVERERYRDLFAHAPLGYVVTDRLGVIHEVNDIALAYLGTDHRFVRRKPLSVLVDAADTRLLRSTMLDAGAQGPIQVRLRRSPGLVCELTCSVTDRGKRLLWALVDVTKRVVPEEALASAERIEAIVAERTQHLTLALRECDDVIARERSIRHQLEHADRAKERFIAILSHDLRGPITSVLGWTHVLRRPGAVTKSTRDTALGAIERATRSQLALVEELLDVSRIAADKLQLDLTALDVGLTVRRTVDSMMPLAADRGIVLSVTVPIGSVNAHADRRRLEQITTNLVSNALRFTPTGGRVDVEVTREGRNALLVVRDNGRGIGPETLPLVFEYFKQDTRDPSVGGGLGLGLYIVKQIVELHGGTVSAESLGEGTGARFEVRLPMHDTEATEITSSAILPDENDLEGVRVLLVEDEEDTRDLLRAVLLDRGATVATASDANSALATFDAFHPDVLVSDIGLPGQDGCSLIRKIRTRAADLPAVAISGFAAQTDADRAVEAGFDLHVAKPMDADQLIEAIQEATHRHER